MIELANVKKTFTHKNQPQTKVLADINLSVKAGEFVTVFGPNGSGKTTLLNIVSGLEKTGDGEVLIDGKTPEQAKVGFVFQNYNESLFPWLTVAENIAFPLQIEKVAPENQKQIVEHLLGKVGLLDLKDKYIYELSGGQRQLVSICRAMSYKPDILLMDEPFSALDYSTTRKMELELLKIWQENKITTLFVSHDVDEAILLADRVVVLSPRPGKVKEIFTIDLPRPRTLDMISSQTFFDLRNKILATFNYD